jgi:hypothetical protein
MKERAWRGRKKGSIVKAPRETPNPGKCSSDLFLSEIILLSS